jgi:hypothetical protein
MTRWRSRGWTCSRSAERSSACARSGPGGRRIPVAVPRATQLACRTAGHGISDCERCIDRTHVAILDRRSGPAPRGLRRARLARRSCAGLPDPPAVSPQGGQLGVVWVRPADLAALTHRDGTPPQSPFHSLSEVKPRGPVRPSTRVVSRSSSIRFASCRASRSSVSERL